MCQFFWNKSTRSDQYRICDLNDTVVTRFRTLVNFNVFSRNPYNLDPELSTKPQHWNSEKWTWKIKNSHFHSEFLFSESNLRVRYYGNANMKHYYIGGCYAIVAVIINLSIFTHFSNNLNHSIFSSLDFMTDLLQERTGRNVLPKGATKQVIQTWSVMGEAFDLESRYKVIDYLGELSIGASPTSHLFWQ